jgi:hypothetical protein
MSLSWLPFGYNPDQPEVDSRTPDTTVADTPRNDPDNRKEPALEPLPNGQLKKATFTVMSTTLNVSADDSSFEDTRSDLSEARQALNARALVQHQKLSSSLPTDNPKPPSIVTVDSSMTEKEIEKPGMSRKFQLVCCLGAGAYPCFDLSCYSQVASRITNR